MSKPPIKRGSRAKTSKTKGRVRVQFGVISGKRAPPDVESLRIKPGRGGIDLVQHPSIARRIALHGYSDEAIMAIANVSQETLDYWKAMHPDLADAIDSGRTEADVQVVESLFKLAVGYERQIEEVAGKDADIVRYTKYYPPELGAIKAWLYNRQKQKWGEKSTSELTGPKGKPLVPKESNRAIIDSIVALVRPKADKKGK